MLPRSQKYAATDAYAVFRLVSHEAGGGDVYPGLQPSSSTVSREPRTAVNRGVPHRCSAVGADASV